MKSRMSKAKQRSEQHLIDAAGERILRATLPQHWVLREYRPDYGLDFALEIFKPADTSKKLATYETLGEHIFIQLKSVQSSSAMPLSLYRRGNVEKAPESLDKSKPADTIDTVRFQLETSELMTVERMGVGVPVLLVIADVESSKCYFVCLNDYVDKILVPRHDDYTTKASRTIHVPTANEISDPGVGQTALSWYGKRQKLYAAFQRFAFQEAELRYAWGTPDGIPMAQYFARRLVKYDFWDDTPAWGLISYYGAAVRRFLETGSPGLMQINEAAVFEMAEGNQEVKRRIEDDLRHDEILQLWRLLTVLPRNYEDVCREWFLPTSLGYAASYPT
jgi:hypothetical protein